MSVNIDTVLAKAEQEVLRLQQQAEQEAAMAAALPLRFEQNMAAFRQHIPHIADIYEAYQPTRPFRFFCNENGIPNLLWLDENTALYGADPFQSAQEQINQVLNRPFIHRFNFGMSNRPIRH